MWSKGLRDGRIEAHDIDLDRNAAAYGLEHTRLPDFGIADDDELLCEFDFESDGFA